MPASRIKSERGTAARLREALLALSGGHGRVLAHSETPWASVTFSGARHRLALEFTGLEQVTGAESFIAALPDHEFVLPGQLVADAAITAVDHTLLPVARMEVACELLLLEEG